MPVGQARLPAADGGRPDRGGGKWSGIWTMQAPSPGGHSAPEAPRRSEVAEAGRAHAHRSAGCAGAADLGFVGRPDPGRLQLIRGRRGALAVGSGASRRSIGGARERGEGLCLGGVPPSPTSVPLAVGEVVWSRLNFVPATGIVTSYSLGLVESG